MDKLRNALPYLDQLPAEKVRAWIKTNLDVHYPDFTYKYRSVSTDEEKRFARDILLNGNIWVSSPTQFNDPFDMKAEIVFEGSYYKKILSMLIKLLELHPKMNHKEWSAIVAERMQMNPTRLLALIRDNFELHLSRTGVYSFSDNPLSVLMWSHYADFHRGICIQFEMAASPSTFFVANPVKYTDRYPRINWTEDSASQLEAVILGKSVQWAYEKERRFFTPNHSNFLHAVNPNAIAGVILGCRATPESKIFINDLNAERVTNGHSPFKVYQAVQSGNEYKLLCPDLPQ